MPVYYWDYLQLDKVLGAQEPRTDAHDEMLFVVVHQAFELWFKQILVELGSVLEVMGGPVVAEKELGGVVDRLGRVTVIQRLLVAQLDVLETMTPLDFLEFRDELIPASGFQSVQFRLIENRLGLQGRLKIKGSPYTSVLTDEHAARITASEEETSLHDHVERWLERTPFLSVPGFDFWSSYQQAVHDMLARDRHVIETHPSLDEVAKAEHLATFEQTVGRFNAAFEEAEWDRLRLEGKRRLSHRAFLAALLINLYRDEPIFQLPFRLLRALVDIDEGFTTWRQRHALMAHRMIGGRIGTGGTSGHEYLEAAARRHRVFSDLFDLPTYFIPRSALPPLPRDVAEQMGFRWT